MSISLKVTIKDTENETLQVRRIQIKKNHWEDVMELITEWCGGFLKELKYVDDEHDEVLLKTQTEWEECIRLMNGVVRLLAVKESCILSHKKQLLTQKPIDIKTLLSLARCESILGFPERSVKYLKRALEKGANLRRTKLVDDPDFQSVVQSRHYCKLFTQSGMTSSERKTKKQKKQQKPPTRRIAVEENSECSLSTNLIYVQPTQASVEVMLSEVVPFSPAGIHVVEEKGVTSINTRTVRVKPLRPYSYSDHSDSVVVNSSEFSSELRSVKELVGETSFPELLIIDLLRKNAGDIFRVCFHLLQLD